mmetsp:Transcript_50573/g.145807  ORF Transcript_50573/g.145807 Transcript_50573/m.145807 type:complete len:230 (+) Transcript_50573:557-1246(+)
MVLSTTYCVPSLPLIVTHPSLPSDLARAGTRVTFRSGSSCGSPVRSRSSPSSSFRTTAPASASLVRAMLHLQTRASASSKDGAAPAPSRMVTQPVRPSFFALPRTRMTSTAGSRTGPSNTSKASPPRKARAATALRLHSFRIGTSGALQSKYGLPATSKNGVPWLPRSVIQPSPLSRMARPRARSKPTWGSVVMSPSTSTTSPSSNFLMISASCTAKVEVSTIGFTTAR